MRAGVVVPCVDGVGAYANFLRFRADADDGYRCVAPPRVKRAAGGAAGDRYRIRRDFAGIIHLEEFAFLVPESVAVVFIERAATVVAGVNAQLERPGGLLAGALRHRLHGNNGAGANVEGHFVERGMQGDLVCAGEFLRSPIVVPFAGRELHFLGVDHFTDYRRDEEIAAKKKIAIVAVKAFLLRVIEKDGAHERQTSVRAGFDAGVNIGEQLVAQLDVTTADGFLLRAMDPGLLIGGSLSGVVTIDGVESTNFKPAREEIGGGRACEAADVVTDESVAAKPEAQQHGRAHSKVIPGAAVIAGPGGCVALSAGIGGAGEYKGPLVGLQLAQAVVGGADIFPAVDVVDGAVIERAAIVEAMPRIERHGFVGALEKRGLVHVVPEAGDAHGDKIFVERDRKSTRLN